MLFLAIRISFCFAVSKSVLYDELMKDGDVKAIIKEFKKNPDMNRIRIGDDKDSLIMRAIKYDRPEEIIRLLLKADVKLSSKNKYGQTALMYACEYSSDRGVLELILKKSGSKSAVRKKILKVDKRGLSALDRARKNPDSSVSDLITSYLTEDDLNKASAPTVILSEDGVQSVTHSEEPESVSNAAEPAELPAEETAAEEETVPVPDVKPEEPEVVETAAVTEQSGIEESGAQMPENIPPAEENPVDKYKKTYLYDYMLPENLPAAEDSSAEPEKLAEIKNPDKRDKNGRTALMKAVKSGNDWEIRSLLKSGADVNISDSDGWTALMYAVRYQNSLDTVNILLKNGADIQSVNKYGYSALQLAASYSSNPDVLKKILSLYPSGTNEIFRAFVLSLSSSPENLVAQFAKIEAFIDFGVPLNRFYEGKTPLMYAAEFSSSTKIIKLLLDNGAVPAIRSAEGKTAFEYAKLNTQLEHDETYWSLNSR